MLIFNGPTSRHALSVRPVLFHSKVGDNAYFSSHGGTVVLVRKSNRLYGVTCQHVLGGHVGRDLTVHFDLAGDTGHKPNLVVNVVDGGISFSDTEIEDVLVVRWENHDQFGDAFAEAVDLDTFVPPAEGDVLGVVGFLKSRSDYFVSPAKTFCFQTVMVDIGIGTADPLLRKASVELDTENTEDAAGMSGGYVFNITKQAPAGLIIRGSSISKSFTLHYLPFEIIKGTIDFIDALPDASDRYVVPEAFNFKIKPLRPQHLGD